MCGDVGSEAVACLHHICMGLTGLTAMLGSEFWPRSLLSLWGMMSTMRRRDGKVVLLDVENADIHRFLSGALALTPIAPWRSW